MNAIVTWIAGLAALLSKTSGLPIDGQAAIVRVYLSCDGEVLGERYYNENFMVAKAQTIEVNKYATVTPWQIIPKQQVLFHDQNQIQQYIEPGVNSFCLWETEGPNKVYVATYHDFGMVRCVVSRQLWCTGYGEIDIDTFMRDKEPTRVGLEWK